MDNDRTEAEFFEPQNELIKKTGTGGLSEATLKAIQSKVDSIRIDVEPFLVENLETIKSIIHSDTFLKGANSDLMHEYLSALVAFNVHIKMTDKKGLSHISNSLLRFSERLQSISIDSHHVIKAHVNAMDVILKKSIDDSNQTVMSAFIKELNNACDRYETKYKANIRDV